MNAPDWGWKCENNRFQPVLCASSAAPRQYNESGSLQLSNCVYLKTYLFCRGYGLPCKSTYGQGQVESRENPFNPSSDMDSDLDNTDKCDI